MHPFLNKTLAFIVRNRLLVPDSHLAVGVSGGADSVALACVLYALAKPLAIERITALHFDHHLRGDESRADRRFVEDLAGRLEWPLVCGEAQVGEYREKQGGSLEMAARACRHRFFRESMERLGARCLALGHTADDQAEEIIMRLLRGTGPQGMAGMPARSAEGIVRPLLFAQRAEVLRYLDDVNQPFREDSSNRIPICQRNALRLQVMPLLRQIFHGQLTRTICRHAGWVRDDESWWAAEMDKWWPQVVAFEDAYRVRFDIRQLLEAHPALQRRLLRAALLRLGGDETGIYGVHLEALIRWFPKAHTGSSLHLPRQLRVDRTGDFLEAHRVDAPFLDSVLVVPGPGRYAWNSWALHIEVHPVRLGERTGPFADTPLGARIDAQKVRWPLTVRPWSAGDRFQPLGMTGTKKLQDLFSDCKLPRRFRHRIPLLCDPDKICWVIGLRLDERVKVAPETRQVLLAQAWYNGSEDLWASQRGACGIISPR